MSNDLDDETRSAVSLLPARRSEWNKRRLLVVACPKFHGLLAIYASASGPVYVAEGVELWSVGPGSEDLDGAGYPKGGQIRSTRRGKVFAGRLDDLDHAEVSCRCRTCEIDAEWVREELARLACERLGSARRRVIYDDRAQRATPPAPLEVDVPTPDA